MGDQMMMTGPTSGDETKEFCTKCRQFAEDGGGTLPCWSSSHPDRFTGKGRVRI